MTAEFRLRALGVAHLEYVFTPAGLPLVDKGDGKGGTTSILIRGGAGSGKTTLALALAHSIAKHQSGVVLFLSTEFSPAEVVFKAKILGLPEGTVAAWPGSDAPRVVSILVQSLSVLDAAADVDGSASRKIAAFNALHALLAPEDGRAIPIVKAVVLDALTLPVGSENEGLLRERLLEMIQALEHRGISTVLVEEAAPGASEWAAFVVDVVFELSMVADPETSELSRKLACPKSRYALSQAGPHFYGLDSGTPAVWPNLLRFIALAPELQVKPISFVLPVSSPENWTICPTGAVLLSLYDRTGLQLLRAISSIPGADTLRANCGSISRIGGLPTLHVQDDEGPASIGWAILKIAHDRQANVCVVSCLEALIQRQSWRVPLLQTLEALAAAGFVVVVHGESTELASIQPIARYVSGGKANAVHRQPQPYCGAMRWLAAQHYCALDGSNDFWTSLVEDVWQCSSPETFAMLRERAATYVRQRADGIQAFHSFWGLLQGPGTCGTLRDSDIAPMEMSLLVTVGQTWAAATAALHAFKNSSPKPETPLVWACVQALMAGNPHALEVMAKRFDSGRDPWLLGPLSSALAQAERIAEAEERIKAACFQQHMSDWYLERCVSELRMLPGNDAALREAKERLVRILSVEGLPLIHRAEIQFNIGWTQEMLGDKTEALASYRSSQSMNANLVVARESIERLTSSIESDPIDSLVE